MVAKCAATAMAAHDGCGAQFQGVVEALLGSMAQIDHDAQPVHLADDLSAEGAHTVVGMTAACRVADVVVAIVAEGHIDDAALCEVLQVFRLSVDGQSVLYAQHDALPARLFVGQQVGRRAGYGEIVAVAVDDVFYLVEDDVGIFLGTVDGEIYQRRERLAVLGLRQVGHHDGGVLTAFRHLVQVNEYALVAAAEIDPFRKQHRRIAVCVEGQHAAVHVAGFAEGGSLLYQPAEQGQSVSQAFRMCYVFL